MILRDGTRFVCCLFGLFIAWPILAAEKFKHLGANEVNRLFLGRTICNEAHWSSRFAADGGVESMELGNMKQSVWRFSHSELCLEFKDQGKPVSDCNGVGLPGNNVRFLRDGMMTAEGILLDD